MKLLDRLKIAMPKNGIGEYIAEFLRGDDTAGEATNYVDKNYSAVWACIKVISETLASLPLIVYKRDGKTKTREDKLPIADVLHYSANPYMVAYNFKEAMMMSILQDGNAYAHKLKNKQGEVVGLQPIKWKDVTVELTVNNEPVYKIKKGTVETQYTREDIFHIVGLSENGYVGMSPLEFASNAIKLGQDFNNYNSKFLKQGAHTSGVLEMKDHLSDQAFLRLKKEFNEQYIGMKNTGKPMILEEGMEFKPIGMKLSDAQFLESRKFQIEEIARYYRVPLHMIQSLDRSTNNNIETQSLEFVKYTMLPWIKRYEEAVTQQLLTDRQRKDGYFVEFKVDAILRGDYKSRTEGYKNGILSGWMSPNEARSLENMNPVDGLDIYFQQLNMADINVAKEIQMDNNVSNGGNNNE